jgi:hypothetical protein
VQCRCWRRSSACASEARAEDAPNTCGAGLVLGIGTDDADTIVDAVCRAEAGRATSGLWVVAAPVSDAGGCPAYAPLTSTQLDANPGWKCPVSAKGACSTTELAQIQANLDDTSVTTWVGLATGVDDACKSCMLAETGDANWAPIVATTGSAGELGFYNFGACFGFMLGASCGRAVRTSSGASMRHATARTRQVSETHASRRRRTLAACAKGFVNAFTSSCPSLGIAPGKCNNIIDAIETLCGP